MNTAADGSSGSPPVAAGTAPSSKAAPSATAGFFFQKRYGRLDWRKLAGVDLNEVVSRVDVDTLQDNVEHLTFSDIGEEDLRYFTDANFIKIFRLCQLTIEYLLNVQNYLSTELSSRDTRVSELEKALAQERSVSELKDADFFTLKQQLKYQAKVTKAYQHAVSSLNRHKGEEGKLGEATANVDVAYVRLFVLPFLFIYFVFFLFFNSHFSAPCSSIALISSHMLFVSPPLPVLMLLSISFIIEMRAVPVQLHFGAFPQQALSASPPRVLPKSCR